MPLAMAGVAGAESASAASAAFACLFRSATTRVRAARRRRALASALLSYFEYKPLRGGSFPNSAMEQAARATAGGQIPPVGVAALVVLAHQLSLATAAFALR